MPQEWRTPAIAANRPLTETADHEIELAAYLRRVLPVSERIEVFHRHAANDTAYDEVMRRILLRSLVKKMGHDVRVGLNVRVLHPETFEFGDKVTLCDYCYLQGRHDGFAKIGNGTWLGPNSYFDARALTIGDYVGWGPGAKLLTSSHTGVPNDIPFIKTDVVNREVIIGDGVDVGVNAVLLPGIVIGADAIIGAGAVVTKDVAARQVVAGVPAKCIAVR